MNEFSDSSYFFFTFPPLFLGSHELSVAVCPDSSCLVNKKLVTVMMLASDQCGLAELSDDQLHLIKLVPRSRRVLMGLLRDVMVALSVHVCVLKLGTQTLKHATPLTGADYSAHDRFLFQLNLSAVIFHPWNKGSANHKQLHSHHLSTAHAQCETMTDN